jgi:alkaline phosphatase D
MTSRISGRNLGRRSLLLVPSTLALPGGTRFAFGQGTAPAVVTSDAMRPRADQGLMIGDVTGDRAIVWSRSDRPARMIVEWATREDFANARRVRGPHGIEDSDFTARIDLIGLPAGEEIFTRVTWLDLGDLQTSSVPVTGRFRTMPAGRRDINFLWSGDCAGQGWGINPDFGGMKIFETMRRLNPDFFIHNGDTIYADGPIQREVRLPDGTMWRNIVTEEKSKVAETLAEFRGNYKYNLLDEHVRRFNAEVPQIWQWDDHEVTNNWSGSKDLSADNRYTEKRVPLLIGRATKAFLEYAPLRRHGDVEAERVYRHIPYGASLDVFVIDMRAYRGPNSHNRQERAGTDTDFLGAEQIRWLKEGLLRSRATWKVIAADMPIGLLVGDGKDAEGRDMFEAVANGNGPALGREIEIAGLLSAVKHNGVKNVIWLTADTHYTGAHYFDPAKAQFTDFAPFWEFMSGPLNAGTFGPNAPDDTFGMQVVFQKAPPDGQVNVAPTAGLQFFGQVQIDGRSEEMTVTLRDLAGTALWSRSFAPERA